MIAILIRLWGRTECREPLMTCLLLYHLNLLLRLRTGISRGMMFARFFDTASRENVNRILSLAYRRCYYILPLIGFQSIRGFGWRYHCGRCLWQALISPISFSRLIIMVSARHHCANPMSCLISWRSKCRRSCLSILRFSALSTTAFNRFFSLL